MNSQTTFPEAIAIPQEFWLKLTLSLIAVVDRVLARFQFRGRLKRLEAEVATLTVEVTVRKKQVVLVTLAAAIVVVLLWRCMSRPAVV